LQVKSVTAVLKIGFDVCEILEFGSHVVDFSGI